ncbi:MAG: 4-aminobutyrate--2-oxoglutarate transaminase [Comamonadaceae bacterium]|nr:4-aminobutyrate--2-oxoglutarate transaminase [Comamonadaceae bacterium]
MPNAPASTNAALMSRRQQAIPRGVGNIHEVFIARGENAEIWDVEGRRYIDFAGGIAVLNTGHRHAGVLEAVKDQLERYTHTCFQVLAYEPYVEVAERLNALAPGKAPKKTLLLTTGSEAVENAVKIARSHTGRPGVIAFGGGYHGRTLLTMGLTGKVMPYKKGFGPFPANIFHALFPNPLHGVTVDDAIRSVETLFKNDIEATQVAAMIVEPVQGEGGFYIAPPEFLQRLRTLCDTHGILLIADEVQTGAGRTGTWFAIEQAGVEPDLITTAKSLAGGFPLSAVVGRADIMDTPHVGGLGGTYAGSPLACAAALAVMDAFEAQGLLLRSREIGERFTKRLQAMAVEHPIIGDVRSLGAMVAVELFDGGDPSRPATKATGFLLSEACRRGLILISCGTHGNVMRFLVPLTASDSLLDEGLDILSQCFGALATADLENA